MERYRIKATKECGEVYYIYGGQIYISYGRALYECDDCNKQWPTTKFVVEEVDDESP